MNRSFRLYACLAVTALTLPHPSLATQANPAIRGTNGNTSVPFVGCKSDGQAGALDAPKSAGIEVRLDKSTAERLTLYKGAYSTAVLGPRGWSCYGTYGSGGGTLYVTPEPLKPEIMFSSNWEGIKGPGIEAMTRIGGTSGRYEVAQIVAKAFPTQRAFVAKIIAEGNLPASEFPFGLPPSDLLTYRTDRVVEFLTPAGAQGLGTFNRLRPDTDSIRGVAILVGAEPDLQMLTLRLPQNLNDLSQSIIRQFEASQ